MARLSKWLEVSSKGEFPSFQLTDWDNGGARAETKNGGEAGLGER